MQHVICKDLETRRICRSKTCLRP